MYSIDVAPVEYNWNQECEDLMDSTKPRMRSHPTCTHKFGIGWRSMTQLDQFVGITTESRDTPHETKIRL